MTSSILGRSLGLDLHVHFCLSTWSHDLCRIETIGCVFACYCLNCSLTLVHISGCKYFLLYTSTNIDGFPFLWLRVYSLCLPWTHSQDGLSFTALQEPRIVVGEARTRTPLEQSHRLLNIQAFAVSNISTYSMCHLGKNEKTQMQREGIQDIRKARA